MKRTHPLAEPRAIWLAIAAFACALPVHAANNVAPPNILWHNKATGQNKVWIMKGASFVSETVLPATSDDLGWKAAATGDFNGDGEPDIVWQNEKTGQTAVWFMKGTLHFSGALIEPAVDVSWRLAGVADFNGDGKPDLLWQNLSLGQNAVWLMNGTTPTEYRLITSAGDVNWKIAATGDLNGDGKPDIILRNQSTGQNAVWLMNGLQMSSGDLLRHTSGIAASERDHDWQIVGTGDFNGDGKLDLLWRHCSLGINVCWYLNGTAVTSSAYLGKHEFDADWKICSQDTAESTWRLRHDNFTWLTAAVSLSPPKVTLKYKLVSNTGFGGTIQRRLPTEKTWTTLASGVKTDAYTDSTVSLGRSYEYRVFREGFGGTQYGSAEHTSAALNAPPIEARGKVILLVDKTLATALASGIEQLRQNLVGDGWSVVRHDVPRHIDDYSSSTSFRTNAYNITNVIKPLIRSTVASDPNTKAVFIIGHVAIPYSGLFSPDGHSCGPAPYGPDHRGAWPADMFYGDLDGTWTDHLVNYTNCDFPEPNNVPGDGKFDQDGIASPFVMKLAVGRIDFARMPVFTSTPPPGISPKSEATLLQQYLTKNHRYRSKLLDWQQGNPPLRGMVYGHFQDSRDAVIFENARHSLAAITDNPNGLTVGDFCLQNSKPSVWGFLSGAGACDRINNSIPILEHTAADLTHPANEPKTAFYMLLASFLGDWNMGSNNYLRALLATPNYGLASVWTRSALWRTDALGVGEHLGACHLRMVNDPKDVFYDQSRDLTILGDPTLRLHVLGPPANVRATTSKNKVQLSWSSTETGTQFYIYRGASASGPFARISSAPVSGTTFTDNSPVKQQKSYLVRAIKLVTVGTGSYTNISQGAFVTAN